MIFPPQCTKRWQLYEQMSRVLKMCEEAGFDRPWECVRYEGVICTHINFDYDPKQYEFALCFVEGRPVFRGNVLYELGVGRIKFTAVNADFEGIWAMNGENKYYFSFAELTWNPPQRTIEVKMLREDAERVLHCLTKYEVPVAIERATEAFKTALEGK